MEEILRIIWLTIEWLMIVPQRESAASTRRKAKQNVIPEWLHPT